MLAAISIVTCIFPYTTRANFAQALPTLSYPTQFATQLPPPQCGQIRRKAQHVSRTNQVLTCLQHCTQVARGAIEHVVVKALHSPLGSTGPAALCAAPTHPPCFLHQPPLGLNPLPATTGISHFLNHALCPSEDMGSVMQAPLGPNGGSVLCAGGPTHPCFMCRPPLGLRCFLCLRCIHDTWQLSSDVRSHAHVMTAMRCAILNAAFTSLWFL